LIVKRHVQQAGITTAVTPQILRHSFAAHQLQAGVPLQSIRNQLGYARLSSTRVYQRAANKGIAELEIDGVPLK
jgi:integrase/recombinase XerD